MPLYKKGRNAVLIVVICQFFVTLILMFRTTLPIYIPNLLLIGNLIEHLLAVVFFIGIGVVLWGLCIKTEFRTYKFQFWDILFMIAVLLFTYDFYYTIVTPHPMFHDEYLI